MTVIRFKAICQRVRAINGVVEILLTKRETQTQEEHVLLNIVTQHDQFKEGGQYWIEIQPAFPH